MRDALLLCMAVMTNMKGFFYGWAIMDMSLALAYGLSRGMLLSCVEIVIPAFALWIGWRFCLGF